MSDFLSIIQAPTGITVAIGEARVCLSEAEFDAMLAQVNSYADLIEAVNVRWLERATKLKPIPKFHSEQAEREFWQTHDSCDYIDWRAAERARVTKKGGK